MDLKKTFTALLLAAAFKAGAQQPDSLPVAYRKPLFELEYGKPVLELSAKDSINDNRAFRYYAFSGYREGVEPVRRPFNFNMHTEVDERAGTINQRVYNVSILEMVTFGIAKRSQVILEVKDPARYRYLPSYGPKLEWMRKNAYCYELTVPRGIFDMKQIERDIDGFLKIKRRVEKRNVSVLVISSTDGRAAKMQGYSVPQGPGVVALNDLQELMYDWGLPNLVSSLERNDLLFDLGIDARSGTVLSLESLKQVLAKQGFSLRPEMRTQEFIVISELKER